MQCSNLIGSQNMPKNGPLYIVHICTGVCAGDPADDDKEDSTTDRRLLSLGRHLLLAY